MGENGNSDSIEEGECESGIVVLFISRQTDDDGHGIGTPCEGAGTTRIATSQAVGYHQRTRDETLDVDRRGVTYFAPRFRLQFGTSSLYSVVAIRSSCVSSVECRVIESWHIGRYASRQMNSY